ncbi:MAG TPA: LON peptidase substrate-binding domain-containing protein, partial [bacterium]|nr:LON peptidase substrate-binding domain-containing protein [bacterium]
MNNGNGTTNIIPPSLPVLPLKDSVLFPYMIMNVNVQRGFSSSAVNRAITAEGYLIVTAQKDPSIDQIKDETVYPVGT